VTVVDTNVLSALMRRSPDPVVLLWLDAQPRSSVWTTAITVLEIRFGLRILPAGKRRTALSQAFDTMVRQTIEQRVLPFDSEAAAHAADLMAARRRRGRPVDLRDTMVAGIALAHRATVATGNVRHFDDLRVPIVNPWEQDFRSG
jgi:hypothetical protein